MSHNIILGSYDLCALIAYATAILWLGLRAKKRNSNTSAESYFLDGRRLSLPIFVATLVSTWYGGILGVGEFGYRFGISQWLLLGAPYYIFAIIFAWILVPIIRKSSSISLVDHCYNTLGNTSGNLVSGAVFLLTSPAPYLWMLVAILQLFVPLPFWLILVLVIIFSSCYLLGGRFFTIWSSNTLDFVLMFLGFLFLVPFCINTYGGLDFLNNNLPQSHFEPTGGISLGSIAIWWLMGAWTLVDPGFHQRVRAAQSASTARNGILVSVLAWMLFDFLTLSSALYAKAIMPDLANPAHAYPMLGAQILPDGLFGLFLVSLLATVLSTFNSFSFMAAQTLGQDCLRRIKPFERKRLHAFCIALTLIFASSLVMLMPSAVDMWYMLAAMFLPALLFALVASFGWLPQFFIQNSAWLISLFLGASIIYQII